VVVSISVSIALILLTLIFSYSYLLIQVVTERKQLTRELITVRDQLSEEQKKRSLAETNSQQLLAQLTERDSNINQLQEQLAKSNKPIDTEAKPLDIEAKPPIATAKSLSSVDNKVEEAQLCLIDDYSEIDKKTLRRAMTKTLSTKAEERFEGFTILMNNVEYLSDDLQREVTEYYLNNMNQRNKDGVYYATFILSQLTPSILREYEVELQTWYAPLYQQNGWQRTLSKYCHLENKLKSTAFR
jgi:chromosome segregation ATPase